MRLYWIGGSVASVSTMGIAMCYVVLQWCLQSHLSTLDWNKAARGLQRVKRFRRAMRPLTRTFRLFPLMFTPSMNLMVRILWKCGLRVPLPTRATSERTHEMAPCRRESLGLPADPSTARPHSSTHDTARSHGNLERLPLIIEPDFAHLHSPPRSYRSRSSDERSISPRSAC